MSSTTNQSPVKGKCSSGPGESEDLMLFGPTEQSNLASFVENDELAHGPSQCLSEPPNGEIMNENNEDL